METPFLSHIALTAFYSKFATLKIFLTFSSNSASELPVRYLKQYTLPSKRNATLGSGVLMTSIWCRRPCGDKALSAGVVSMDWNWPGLICTTFCLYWVIDRKMGHGDS